MTVVLASSLPEALTALHELPGSLALAGGTDLVVAMNAHTVHPSSLVTLRRVPELRGVRVGVSAIGYGALTTYTQLLTAGTPLLRAVGAAVGSPASRNAGTIGGALGTASATGDVWTALMAAGAQVQLASALRGTRRCDVHELALARDELITGVLVPVPAGPQVYLKVGQRQAAVGATVACAFTVDSARATVRIALAGVGSTPQRALAAEAFVRDELRWVGGLPAVNEGSCRRVGELTAAVLAPFEHARASPAYRRHAAAVLAARALGRVARYASVAA